MLLEEFSKEIEERRTEKIIEFTKDVPNLIADLPEKKMLIILIDIVGFSKSSTRQQVYDIYRFQRFLITQILSSKFDFSKHIHISQFIPTGDGCYIVADECKPGTALKFLIEMLKDFNLFQTDEDNIRSLRISAEIGNCVPFIDIAKHKNYIGEGMNEAARILAYGQKTLEDKYIEQNPAAKTEEAKIFSRNTLYLGEVFSPFVKEYSDNYSNIFDFKNVSDKHGRTRNIIILQNIHQ